MISMKFGFNSSFQTINNIQFSGYKIKRIENLKYSQNETNFVVFKELY